MDGGTIASSGPRRPAVTLPDSSSFGFEIDPFARTIILAGADEIGYVNFKLLAIEVWQPTHAARLETRKGAVPA